MRIAYLAPTLRRDAQLAPSDVTNPGAIVADPWELICHHTYSGTPGVVYDQSPDHQSHGIAIGLSHNDFLPDGRTLGSGAVWFSPNGRIEIPANKSWQRLDGIRIEMTLFLEPIQPLASFLVDAGTFNFYLRSGLNAWFVSNKPQVYTNIGTHFHGDPNFRVPTGRWVTLGLVHDGFSTVDLTVDGDVVAHIERSLPAVAGVGAICIGNSATAGAALNGLIDEVKVWRHNPHRIFDDFFDRPMDAATARCWVDYRRRLAEWMRANPDCAGKLHDGIAAAVGGAARQALTKGPETRRRTLDSVDEYRRLWSLGQLDSPEMANLLTDLQTWLSVGGIGIEANLDAQRLLDSDCLRRFRSEVTPPECDPQFLAMFRRPSARD